MNFFQPKAAVLVVITVLTLGGFALDMLTPVGVTDWVWYFIPLLLTIFVRSRFLPFILVPAFSVLTLVGLYLSPPGIDSHIALVNGLMGIMVLWLVALLIHLHLRNESLLIESETRYRALFQGMQEGLAYCRMIYERDRPRNFIYLSVNPAFERITGLKEVTNKRVTEVIPGIKETHPELFEIYHRVASTGRPEKFEFHLENLRVWLSISVYSPAKDHFIAIFEDITARLQAQESLKLFRALVDHSNDAFEVVDPDTGRFLDVNESLCRNLGYTREELLSLSVPDLDPVVARSPWPQRRDEIRNAGSAIVEGEHRRKDGTTFPVEVSLRWVHLERDFIVAVVRDITTQQKLEAQFRQSQKMEAVGRLACGVAHDFNNLLTVIDGYCGLSMQTLEGANPLQKNIAEIQNASDRAASLTRQLLAFSRKQVLQPRVLRLNNIVQNMERMLRRLIGEDIELITNLVAPIGCVKADPGQIEQVIMNLAVNARDALPRGGKLTIGVSNVTMDQKTISRSRSLDPGEYVLIAVSDNGAGMSAEVKEHLFEPFFTTKGLGKGTGLGLATCYGIISQSGGDIRVYSELNSGTTFKIYLPRVDATPEPLAIRDCKPLPGGTESILIVEDDSSVRALAAIILRKSGYRVQESGNASEALELINGYSRCDLVIADVVMPQMSGKELCNKIKGRFPQTKVLLISGYTNDALVHHGVLEEGLFFLEKPFSPLKLTRKVREVLDASKPNQVDQTDCKGVTPV